MNNDGQIRWGPCNKFGLQENISIEAIALDEIYDEKCKVSPEWNFLAGFIHLIGVTFTSSYAQKFTRSKIYGTELVL